jgi:type IV pilus assembly protein PilB
MESKLVIRLRIDGMLTDAFQPPLSLAPAISSRLKVMTELDIANRHSPQDGHTTVRVGNRKIDIRLSVIPTVFGERVVLRLLDQSQTRLSLDEVGMTRAMQGDFVELVSRNTGMILVTGPTGSGKTTTLYGGLGKIDRSTRNVMTIEDPIENRILGVNQAQVSADMRFSDGLRAMLRQDPDVIMIGEIRDDETARIGIRAAVTGVLVFSSIHGSDSPSTIGNLYNFGIPGYQLSNSLLGIVSQRLIRKICPYCRINYPADEKVLRGLDLDPQEHEGLLLHRGQGCPACFQTGYLGRTGIFEIMEVGDELRDLIFQQIPKDVLRRVAIDLGMQTLKQSAVDKILEGVTTAEEVYRVVSM